MSLEDVKVGDRVWMGQRAHGGWKRLSLYEVASVTPTGFRLVGHPKDFYKKATGLDYVGANYRIIGIATPEEITAWEAKQTQEKTEREARDQAQKEAYEAKCERAVEIRNRFRTWLLASANAEVDGDVVRFTLNSHRYEIRELEE